MQPLIQAHSLRLGILINAILLILCRIKCKLDPHGLQLNGPALALIFCQVIRLVEQQQYRSGRIVLQAIGDQVVGVVQKGVARVHNLESNSTALHNTPQLTPNLQILLKWSDLKVRRLLLQGGDLTPPLHKGSLLSLIYLIRGHFGAPSRLAGNAQMLKSKLVGLHSLYVGNRIRSNHLHLRIRHAQDLLLLVLHVSSAHKLVQRGALKDRVHIKPGAIAETLIPF